MTSSLLLSPADTRRLLRSSGGDRTVGPGAGSRGPDRQGKMHGCGSVQAHQHQPGTTAVSAAEPTPPWVLRTASPGLLRELNPGPLAP